jgi:flagellar biosynthetic protein FliO
MGGSGFELPGLGSSLALSFLSLGLVCVVAYGVLRWLGRSGMGRSSANIRVLGYCSLEPRRSVYLVETAGRCFLLGVGDGPVNLLAEVERSAVADQPEAGTGPKIPFVDVLARLLRRRGS